MTKALYQPDFDQLPELENEVTADMIAEASAITAFFTDLGYILDNNSIYVWNDKKKLFVNTQTDKTLTARQARKLLDELAYSIDDATSTEILSDPTSLERNYTDFWSTFAAVMLQAYLLGIGGKVNLTDTAKEAFTQLLQEQKEYYVRFGTDLVAGKLSLAQISDRFRMYANANRSFYEQGRLFAYGGGQLVLPAYPGRVTCGGNCKCYLNIKDYSDRWEITWVRTAKESCDDCVYYGSAWQPLLVYKGLG